MEIRVEWPDMHETEKIARLTGFRTNEIFFARGSEKTWNRVFKAVFGCSLFSFLSPCEDYAGSGFAVSGENCPRLETHLMRLTAYTDAPISDPESVWDCFTQGNREKTVRRMCREVAALIKLALEMPGAKIIFEY